MTPTRCALQLPRRSDARLCEHGRERLLHERHHADDVGALLAREPEVVDVEDREVGAARLELLERVRRRARRLDVELDALGVVVFALRREVDPRVHRVGLEVEQQRRLRARAVGAGIRPAAGQQREHEQEQQRAAHGARRVGEWE